MKATEEIATVVSVEPVAVDGAAHADVVVRFDDGREERARLRGDLVPPGLAPGQRVSLVRAALYRRWTIARAAG